MPIYNEDRLSGRMMTWSGGRVVLVAAASAAAGFVIGLLF